MTRTLEHQAVKESALATVAEGGRWQSTGESSQDVRLPHCGLQTWLCSRGVNPFDCHCVSVLRQKSVSVQGERAPAVPGTVDTKWCLQEA